MKRRSIWSVFLAGILCLIMSASVLAGTTYTEGYLYYEIADESVVITGYFGSSKTVKIPSDIAGYPVSEIAAGAFAEGTAAATVYLPDTIMTIEDGAFDGSVKVVYGDGSSSEENADQTDNKKSGDSSEESSSSKKSAKGDIESTGETTASDSSDSNEKGSADSNSSEGGKSGENSGEASEKSSVGKTDSGQNTTVTEENAEETTDNSSVTASFGVDEQDVSLETEAAGSQTSSSMTIKIIIPILAVILCGIGIFIYKKRK